MEITYKILIVLLFIYFFMVSLDLFSIFFPERWEKEEDNLKYYKPHSWFAAYPVKTPKGWRIFVRVNRKQEWNGVCTSENSLSWWIYL